MASTVGALIDANPGKVIVSPIMCGGSQIMDEILALASLEYPGIGPTVMPLKLKRYDGTTASDTLVVEQDLPNDGTVKGKVVIFFDEVVDAGDTAKRAIDRAKKLKAQLVVFVTLTDKAEAHRIAVENEADHFVVGFTVPRDFLLGWGMDWHGMGRWFKWIGRLRDGKTAICRTPNLPDLVAAIPRAASKYPEV
jgi:hypoxanthine-guanine phosphoribosyltransferase